MSRASSALSRRPLSTTEELEKLEQQITLTLQEIDQNFNKAHRIVTSSILPVVEQYGDNCRAVWDASKFWKQFFEAAANVSLSGYEDLANDGDTSAAEEGSTTVTTNDETSTDYTPQRSGVDQTPSYHSTERDDSLLTDGDGDLSGSTPRPPATKSMQVADLDSPYEALRREFKQGKADFGTVPASASASVSTPTAPRDNSSIMLDVDNDDDSAADSILLAQHTARLPDMSMTPRQSPDEQRARALEEEQATARRQKDPLMHRVLDKTYRIQATPHKTAAGTTAGGIARGISPMRLKVTDRGREPALASAAEPTRAATKTSAWQDSSPMSSPEMAVPKLRSAAFMSPVRQAYRSKLVAAASGPRTPGVSVQTPARNKTATTTLDFSLDDDDTENMLGKRVAAASGGTPLRGVGGGTTSRKDRDEITWESSDEEGDDDLYGGMSPPKTISFALPPSKLLQTPAREASKRIVEDILMSAGGEDMDKSSEYSPTMVKMNANILDDTF